MSEAVTGLVALVIILVAVVGVGLCILLDHKKLTIPELTLAEKIRRSLQPLPPKLLAQQEAMEHELLDPRNIDEWNHSTSCPVCHGKTMAIEERRKDTLLQELAPGHRVSQTEYDMQGRLKHIRFDYR